MPLMIKIIIQEIENKIKEIDNNAISGQNVTSLHYQIDKAEF